MAELPVRPDPVRDVAIATRGAVVDRAEEPQPALAVAVAESLSYWLPALLAACAVSAATYVALDPANARRTATFLMRGPTEPIAPVATAADLSRFIGSINARSETGRAIDFAVRAERGSELATVVITLAPADGEPEAIAAADRIAAAANLSLADALERAGAEIDASLEASRRSSAETSEMLARISSTTPQSEAIAGLMQQVALLRDEQSKLAARATGLQGIRVTGNAAIAGGRSPSLRWLATLAAAAGTLVAVPIVLRFARQVADTRRALRQAQAR